MTLAATNAVLGKRADELETGPLAQAAAWARGIAEVTVVCSSSRGGSSVLFRALSRSPEILSPRGEETPFVRSSIRAVHESADDSMTGQSIPEAELNSCRAAFATDVGVGTATRYTDDLDRYIADLAQRLPWQWCGLTQAMVMQTAHRLAGPAGAAWRTAAGWDGMAFFRALIGELADLSLVDPRYYDGDPLLDRPLADGAPVGPPGSGRFVEEPPFIPILPRQRPAQGAPTRILLKAPASCHRLELLNAIFPVAKIKVLHLVRNPAATVNGLIDGWRHWGFFSRDVGQLGAELDISGYSDAFPWGRNWWKFDLPPGWQDHAGDPLERVCAFQWAACHGAIADFVHRQRPEYLRISFEDLIAEPSRRRRTLARAADFAGVRDVDACAEDLPGVVMSTVPPVPGRWRRRATSILAALTDPQIRAQAEYLGYQWEGRGAWT